VSGVNGWLGTLLGGGAVAILGAITLMIRALLSKTTIDADAAGQLNAIAIAQLNTVRKDAQEQITQARTDANTAVERALGEVKRARADAEEARVEATEARKAANAARRDAAEAREAVDESNRRYARLAAELFQGTDPAVTIERLKAMVRGGTANGRSGP